MLRAPPRIGGPASAAPRLGVAFPGDVEDPAAWSGTPNGIVGALRGRGVDVVGLRAEPGRGAGLLVASGLALPLLVTARASSLGASARLAHQAARSTAAHARVNSWALRHAMRGAGPFDAVLQIATNYAIATQAPIVTLEDMTVVQALALGYPHLDALSTRARERRIAQQRRAYDVAAACCGLSPWATGSMVVDYGVASEKVTAVGVGANHVPQPGPRSWATPRFLFVGADWQRKNGDAVLRAFGRLHAERPEATLDLVGEDPGGQAPGVTRHGVLSLRDPRERAGLEDLFARATCFVMPSHVEPSALAYAEALAAGIPSIGTVRGGSGWIIGDAGVLVEPTDDEALLDAMRRLCDPGTARALGERARARAPMFSWEAVADRLVAVLAEVAPRFREV